MRQVVVLAAGLDSRAYQLEWPAATTIFELDRPQVLDFKREVLSGHGARPRAERREIAVDLREDWPQALRDSGFDAAKPSALIAEGLLIYLPAAAQEQLFTGVDGLAAHGSHVAIEDGTPLEPDEFEAAVEEERAAAANGDQRLFFRLVYNDQCAPAIEWFGQRGWTAVGTPLADYLRQVGRPVAGPETESGPMIARNTPGRCRQGLIGLRFSASNNPYDGNFRELSRAVSRLLPACSLRRPTARAAAKSSPIGKESLL